MMSPQSRILAWAGLALWAPACLSAEPPSLEDLFSMEVEGASRYTQPLAEAPSTATVVTADDIARYGHRTLMDALGMARGVYRTYDRAYSYIGIRGFSRPGDYNSRLLLMVDGARYNDVVYDQAMVGTEAPIDIAWVRRIEFVPGASSALYGGNALFGIANATLWSGADLEGTKVTAFAGSGRETGVSILSGKSLADGGDWMAGLSTGRSSGGSFESPEFAAPGVSDGVAHNIDGERWMKAYARYSSNGWRFTASYADRRKEVPTAYYGTLFDAAGNYVHDRHAHLDLAHASPLSEDWGQSGRVHFGWYSYDAQYVYPGLTNRDEALASWWSGEYRLNYHGWAGHQVQVGVEGQHRSHMDQRNYDLAPRVTYLDDHRTGNTFGGYLQDEWRLSQRWIANLGYRMDRVENNDAIGSPRVALIFRPLPEISAKVLYGKAFRAANAYERFYTDGNLTQKANPSLKPERITTTELAVDYAITPTLRVGVGHYANRINNLIEQITDPNDGLLVYTNRPTLTARGWEVDGEALLAGGWHIRGSMTWQEVMDAGGEPPNSPRHVGKLFVDGPLAETGWTLGLEIQALSQRRALTGTVPGHAVGNLTLRQQNQGPAGQWSVVWRNLGDTRFNDPAGPEHFQSSLRQPGREWRVQWEHHL